MDHARIIAAARRLARRTAKKTDLSYQRALDKVARDLGREHWAAFAANPVEVPRDVENETDVGADEPLYASAMRLEEMGQGADRNPIGPGMLPPEGPARERHVERVVGLLLPETVAGQVSYFDNKGRDALEGFTMAEIALAGGKGRDASFRAMIGWIREGFRKVVAERRSDDTPANDTDGMGAWIAAVVNHIPEGRTRNYVGQRLIPLVSMHERERNAVLGTMDRGLMAFMILK